MSSQVREVRREQRSGFYTGPGILGGPDIKGPLMERYPEEEPEFTKMDKSNTWDGRMVNDELPNKKEV